MHYYNRNIGDYHKKAGRLTMLQHGAYVLLMDAIYDREKFPTLDEAIDWLWASDQSEIDAVTFVLTKFFKLDNGVYVQSRMQEELEHYQGVCLTNAINGKKGGRPKKITEPKAEETQSVIIETESVSLKSELKANESDLKPNQEPITTNHKPITNNQDKTLTSPSAPDDASLIYDYWSTVLDKGASKPTKGRMDKIKARLKDGYTVDQIKQAIDGCKSSDHHMGKNDSGTKYDCLTLICRSAEKLEQFIGYAQSIKPTDQRDSGFDAWANGGQQPYTQGETIDHE